MKKRFVLLVAVAACWGIIPAQAVYELDPVVVTAKRDETRLIETPATVSVVTKEELDKSGAPNLYEAMRLVTGVSSYSYGTGGQSWGAMNSKINIRGVQKGTVVMVDGAPINLNETYFLETLPMDAIERVEIVKGASSVLYGSEATAGVLNIITRENMRNSVSISIGEYGKYRQNFTVGNNKFSLAGNFVQEDELRGLASNGRGMNDREKYDLYFRYRFNDKLSISHQHNIDHYNFNQYDTKTWQQLKEDSRFRNYEDFTRLQYRDDDFRALVYYNRSKRHSLSQKVKKGELAINKEQHSRFDSIGLDVQNEWDINDSLRVLAGFTIVRDGYKLNAPWNRGKPEPKRVNAHRNSYGIFAQVTQDFANDITLTLGARQQWVDGNKHYSAFTPDISLLKKLSADESVYFHAGKSFKMPNFTQMYGTGSSIGTIFEPNPYLEPEEGWSYELGYKKQMNNGMFTIAAYYMDLDSITYETVTVGDQDFGKRFNSKYLNQGIEVEYRQQVNDYFSYRFGMNFGRPREKDISGEWQDRFAKQQYTLGLNYAKDKWATTLSGSLTRKRVGGWKDLLPLNLHIGYKLNNASELALDIENLLDREDIVGNWSKPSSTRYYALGRNMRLTY